MYSFTIYLDLRFMYVSNDIFQKQTGSLRSYENCHFLYENLNLAEIRLLFINSNKIFIMILVIDYFHSFLPMLNFL